MRTLIYQIYRFQLIFIPLGILLGSISVSLLAAVTAMDWSKPIIDTIIATMLFVLLGTFWGIIIAIKLAVVPAALVGFSYWYILKKFTTKNPVRLVRFIIGAGLGVIITTTFFCFYMYDQEDFTLKTVLVWATLPGMVAGGFCALNITQNFYDHLFVEKTEAR